MAKQRFSYVGDIPTQTSSENEGVLAVNEHYELSRSSDIMKPPFTTNVEYLVVAGGGNGGGGGSGFGRAGGGAGGVRNSYASETSGGGG